MTIVSLDLMLRAERFVGSRGGKRRLGEFARICRRRRSCDSFRNRPYGRPILLCPKGNEGMTEAHHAFVTHLHPKSVEEHHGIEWLQRSALPGRNLVEHRVRHRAD